MTGAVSTRLMLQSDWSQVVQIYAEGIATGNATFEQQVPTWTAFAAARPKALRLVSVDAEGRVAGWAAASRVSPRAVYRGVVEHSIYVARESQGTGIGHRLLADLILACERDGVWTIQSGIFPENTPSLVLHAAHGFREVGVRERIGLMAHGPWAGQWRDNVFVERRSR